MRLQSRWPRRPLQLRRGRSLAFVLGVASFALAAALLPSEAAGQRKRPATAQPDAGARNDPANITAISQFMETVVKGTATYNAKDYPGAIDLFKKAVLLNPRDPLGSYLLGEAYLATNNLPEAEAAFKAAVERSDSKFQLVRSHVLFSLADVYERQKKWELARDGWKAYAEHAARLGADGGGHPQSGAARLKVVEDWLKLDQQYDIVRQRIAAEKADAGAQAPGAATPPASKKK